MSHNGTDRPTQTFGLRYWRDGKPMVLLQIAGNGRIRLSSEGKSWWQPQPKEVSWEVFESEVGQAYSSCEEARRVAQTLG